MAFNHDNGRNLDPFLTFTTAAAGRFTLQVFGFAHPANAEVRLHGSDAAVYRLTPATILNLRGKSPKGYYLLEKEACDRHGIQLVDFQLFSREIPTPAAILEAKRLFDSIAYPALMHCKSGADRAGLREGDVITAVAGREVSNVSELLSAVAALKPGVPSRFNLQRQDGRAEVDVTPGTRPKPRRPTQ